MGGAHAELEEGSLVKLDFSKLDKVASKKCDVVPVVVQDSATGAVLIAAYVNQIALDETFKQRVCCLWSTSRNELWVKGLTSGDTLDLDEKPDGNLALEHAGPTAKQAETRGVSLVTASLLVAAAATAASLVTAAVLRK